MPAVTPDTPPTSSGSVLSSSGGFTWPSADSGSADVGDLPPAPARKIGRRELAEVECRPPHTAALFAIDLRLRWRPRCRRSRRCARRHGGRRGRVSRTLAGRGYLVAQGVHALQIGHVVVPLGGHFAAFRALHLMDSRLSAGRIICLELLVVFPLPARTVTLGPVGTCAHAAIATPAAITSVARRTTIIRPLAWPPDVSVDLTGWSRARS